MKLDKKLELTKGDRVSGRRWSIRYGIFEEYSSHQESRIATRNGWIVYIFSKRKQLNSVVLPRHGVAPTKSGNSLYLRVGRTNHEWSGIILYSHTRMNHTL